VPKLSINLEEILSRDHEEQNKVLWFSILINCRIIINNAYYKYIIIAQYNSYISNKSLIEERD